MVPPRGARNEERFSAWGKFPTRVASPFLGPQRCPSSPRFSGVFGKKGASWPPPGSRGKERAKNFFGGKNCGVSRHAPANGFGAQHILCCANRGLGHKKIFVGGGDKNAAFLLKRAPPWGAGGVGARRRTKKKRPFFSAANITATPIYAGVNTTPRWVGGEYTKRAAPPAWQRTEQKRPNGLLLGAREEKVSPGAKHDLLPPT